MPQKTGIVAVVQLVKHVCRVLVTWRTKIDSTIDAAVVSTLITADQATSLKAYLDATQGACDILKLITGY